MKLSIEQEVLQKVVDYLVQQPFKDVAPLINLINQSVKPIQEEPKKEEPSSE
jgi:hypothetical protein